MSRASGAVHLLFLGYSSIVRRRDFGAFERALLEDAALLARLRDAAGVE